MRGLNQITVTAAIAHSPELRYSREGMAILDFTLAGDQQVTTPSGDKSLPFYLKVSAVGKAAEDYAQKLTKGTAVVLSGMLEQRSWEDPQGGKKSVIQVKPLRIEALARGNEDLVTDKVGAVRLQRARTQATLIGTLGRDPELRYTAGGDAVVSVSIAVSENWKGQDGEWKEKTHWLELTLWRALAEQIATLSKGTSVLVTGQLKNESWTDKEGQKRSTLKLEVLSLEAVLRGAATQPSSAAQRIGSENTQLVATSAFGDQDFYPTDEDLPF